MDQNSLINNNIPSCMLLCEIPLFICHDNQRSNDLNKQINEFQ